MSVLTYKPRNDFVIIKKQKRDKVRGLHMPEASAEGVDFIIHSMGPAVENLEIGQKVMIAGKYGEEYFPVPGEADLIVIKQELVIYTIENNLT